MKLIAVLGTLSFIVAGGIVGIRLLLLSRKTGERPEFLVGLSMAVFALAAQPAVVASQPVREAFGGMASLAVLGVALAANVVTIAALYLFNRAVFRRESPIAGAAVGIAIACALASASLTFYSLWIRGGVIGETSTLTKLGVSTMASNTVLVMTWTAVESLRYWRLMKRRLALGLADPVLVNRFALWGFGAAVCASSPAALIACVMAGLNLTSHPVPMLISAGGGAWIGACWYLSFLPPKSYTRWITARSAAQEVSA